MIAIAKVGEIKHLGLREILVYILMSEFKCKCIPESVQK